MRWKEHIENHISNHPEKFINTDKKSLIATNVLLRTSSLIEREINSALIPLGIDMKEYLALVFISSDEKFPLNPSEISICLNATKVQITRLLDALEKRQFIIRNHSEKDRRSLQIKITNLGTEELKKAVPLVHSVYNKIWSECVGSDTQTIINILGNINEGLTSDEKHLITGK